MAPAIHASIIGRRMIAAHMLFIIERQVFAVVVIVLLLLYKG
jgi:hypothetical protein